MNNIEYTIANSPTDSDVRGYRGEYFDILSPVIRYRYSEVFWVMQVSASAGACSFVGCVRPKFSCARWTPMLCGFSAPFGLSTEIFLVICCPGRGAHPAGDC
jgi:hypothetical protein